MEKHKLKNEFLEKRRNYRNAFTGLITIYKTEGIGRLWRGAVPTMTRGALVNGTQLGTYSRAKVSLLDTGIWIINSLSILEKYLINWIDL